MKNRCIITIVDNKDREQPLHKTIVTTREELTNKINHLLGGWNNTTHTTVENEEQQTIQIAGSSKKEDKMFSILITK